MEAMVFDYKGKRLVYYFKEGKKDNVILMHGYSFNSSVWEKIGLPDAISALGPNVYLIDVPGFPNSVNRFNMDQVEIAGLLKDFIKAHKGRTILLGSSASAYIALKFAENNSDILEGLIL